MRGTSPLLVPLAGVLLLGEPLTLWGWLGVLAIIAGIALLSEASPRRPGAGNRKAPLLALAVGLSIAAYIVTAKSR